MAKAKKFNFFGGVFTPSILTLLGVIMYLRLPWIVGQAGLISTLAIILVAHIVSGSTGLSVASIATDKKVETGGTYYIISRSLGLPIGGTLGWALFSGLSLSVSLYLIGFAEVFLDYFGFEVTLNNIRIAGSLILAAITILTFISTSLTIKTQYIILTIMALSLVSVFFGRHNFTPAVSQLDALPDSLPWITLFAIFFPAVTGFEAGVSMSGDLEDPRKSIPLGTISAIVIAMIVYVGLAVFLSFTVNRDLLVNDTNVLFKIAWIPQLVIAGVLGATLSSALGSILGAPRIMQAVARDKIAPSFLGRGFGPSNEPRNALIFSFIIAQIGILIGELNIIARIVTIFFIITYGFINLTYAIESWASSDFRPSFRIPRVVSIIGALACIILMIQLDIMALAIASVILLSLFSYLKNKELTLNSGDTRSSLWRSLVKMGLKNLTNREINNRNWRPNIILFSGGAQKRPHLVEFGMSLVGKQGIFTNFELIEDDNNNKKTNNPLLDRTAVITLEEFGDTKNIITRRHLCREVYEGISVISSVYGFSGFEPNTILMGWPSENLDRNKFEVLLGSLQRLDYNLAFLNYNKERGFGSHSRIDFWWNGTGNALPLALHLVRFITVDTFWRRAKVRVLFINNISRNTEKFHSFLTKIAESYRIDIQVKIIDNIDKLTDLEIIRTESINTSISIFEIPDFNVKAKLNQTIIDDVKDISNVAGTTLFIRASSTFENFNIIPTANNGRVDLVTNEFIENSVKSLLECVNKGDDDQVMKLISNLSETLEKPFIKLREKTLDTLKSERNIFINQLEITVNEIDDKLQSAILIEDIKIRKKEFYSILNDSALILQTLITDYKERALKEEKDLLVKGVSEYVSQIAKSVASLPNVIKIIYSREDFKQLKPLSISKKVDKYFKLLFLGIIKDNATVPVKLHPSSDYYIYNRRLKNLELFFSNFTSNSIVFFSEVREVVSSYHKIVEQYCKKGNPGNECSNDLKRVSALIKDIRKDNEMFFNGQVNYLFNELAGDIGELSKVINNPQVNLSARKYQKLISRNSKLKNYLNEFPEIWGSFMERYINRTVVDFYFYTLKDHLRREINYNLSEIQNRIDNSVKKYINEYNAILGSITDIEHFNQEGRLTVIQKEINKPNLDDIFSSLLRFINDSTSELPVKITITGSELPKGVSLEDYIESNKIDLNIRMLSSYFLNRELGENIRTNSVRTIADIDQLVESVKNLIKLTNFSLSNYNSDSDSDEKMISKFVENIEEKRASLDVITERLSEIFENGLDNSFEPLGTAVITRSSVNMKQRKKPGEKSILLRHIGRPFRYAGREIVNQFVHLLYRKSEGLLWAKRVEQKTEMKPIFSYNGIGNPEEKLLKRDITDSLPYFYQNLFSGNSGIGMDFWVGMEEECEKGSNAVERFLNGKSGILLVTGEKRSGKSAFSKYLAMTHFHSEHIFNMRAPNQNCSDVNVFEVQLIKLLNNGAKSVDEAFYNLPDKSVIIINDLEIWWERREGGTAVVERIIELMNYYGNKILFIVNVNKYSLNIINKLTSINSWLIDLILCQPFSAIDIKELIMLRHKAGGLKFIYQNRREEDMTNWEFAALFNRIFKLSSGNPGYAISVWLDSIIEFKGGILYLKKPTSYSKSLVENLTDDQILCLLQFVLHRRFTKDHLTSILKRDHKTISLTLQSLLNRGLINEKSPGVFSLEKMTEQLLIEKFKTLELI